MQFEKCTASATRVMRHTTLVLTLALTFLAGSAAFGQVEIEVTNHLIDTAQQRPTLYGDLVAFLADEGTYGEDLNGDGDRYDSIVNYLDLSSGVITDLNIAGSNGAFQGDLMLFAVSERNQGATDYNGDGDSEDWVPFVHRISTGETTSLGLAGRYAVLGEEFVAFLVDEESQGADLNGDGDQIDAIAHVFNTRTMTMTNLMVSTWGQFVLGKDYAVFLVVEDPGRDLNGDGDFNDRVLHIFDAVTGNLHNVGRAAWGVRAVGDLVVFVVREDEGDVDLTGDGDMWDRPLYIFNRQTEEIIEIGVSSEVLEFGDDILAMTVFEWFGGISLNDDDDIDDRVMHVYDFETQELVNLGVVGGSLLKTAGRRVAFRVSEQEEGEDLNGDGDQADYVIHVYDHDTREITNLGLGTTSTLSVDDRSVAFVVNEVQQGVDLNGDGHLDDDVFHHHDYESGVTTNLGLVARGGWGHARGRLAFYVPEDKNGYVDLNGDRSQFVDVLHFFDGQSIQNLGLEGREIVFDGETLVFAVNEDRNGHMDLNGDGDAIDLVLHTARVVELDPEVLIEELIIDVRELINAGEVRFGRGRSLIAELQVALWFLKFNNGERIAAVRIQLFIIKVERMIDRGDLDPTLGNELLAKARTVLELLRN